jgi:hypothetical protein
MYYIGLDVHKKTVSYCVKDASGQVHQEGQVGATRWELDDWMKTLPQPWTVAMEATIFTGWIYDHLLPHAFHYGKTKQSIAKLGKGRPTGRPFSLFGICAVCFIGPVVPRPQPNRWRCDLSRQGLPTCRRFRSPRLRAVDRHQRCWVGIGTLCRSCTAGLCKLQHS